MMSKEKPILFSTEMIQAILNGRKTQTRRIISPPPARKKAQDCPYGHPGDELWVRESFYLSKEFDNTPPSKIKDGVNIWYETNKPLDRSMLGRKRPSIHMPRGFSRIQLTVKEIRVERLQSITVYDIKAEGVAILDDWDSADVVYAKWIDLWDSINGARYDGQFAWGQNPWVWVVVFNVKEIKS